MGVDEEYLRLIYEVKGLQAATDLQTQLVNTGREQKNLKALFDQGAISEELLSRETQRLARTQVELREQLAALPAVADQVELELRKMNGTLTPVDAAMLELGERAELTSRKLEKIKKGAESASKGSKQVQEGVKALTYGIQDFAATSGDLGAKLNSVTNNIPQILGIFGAGGPWVAAIGTAVVAGVSLYRNWGDLMRLFEDKKAIPMEAANSLEGLKFALEKNGKELDKLREKQTLTNSEMARFNELTREQTELENKKAEAQKKKHEDDQFQEMLNEDKSAEAHERGTAFKNATGGKMQEILSKIQKAYEADAEEKIQANFELAKKDMAEFDRTHAGADQGAERHQYHLKRQAEFDDFARLQREGNDRIAKELMQRLLKGDKRAQDELIRLMHNQRDGVDFGDFEKEYMDATPEGKAKHKEMLKKQREALTTIGKSKGIDAEADKVAAAAAGETDPEKQFAAVKAGILKALEAKLKAMGQEGGGEQVEKVAETMARQAMDRVNKDSTTKQRAGLKEIDRSHSIKGLVEGYARIVRKQGWSEEEEFEELTKKIVEELQAELKERGLKSDGPAVQEMAERLARQALTQTAAADKKQATKTARASAAAAKKATAAEKRAQGKRARGVDKDLDTEEKELKQTSMDEELAAIAAQMRAAGGVVGANGRVQRMDAEQQQTYMLQQLIGYLKRSNPGMGHFQAVGLAQRLSSQAFQAADSEADKARTELAGQNLTTAQRNQMAMGAALQTTQMLAAQAVQQQGQAARLQRGFEQVQRQLHAGMRSNQVNGGPN